MRLNYPLYGQMRRRDDGAMDSLHTSAGSDDAAAGRVGATARAGSSDLRGARDAVALRRRREGSWLMVAGGLLLGTLGVFVEEAAQDPLTTVWFRCAFGGVALFLYGAATGRLRELRLVGRARWAALGAGVLMVANWALFFAAIPRTSIGVATVVFHVQPLWVMVFGALWLGEAAGRSHWLAALVALAGLALASGLLDPAQAALAQRPGYFTGLLLCLGGSLSYAGVTLIAKTARTLSSFALAWWQCLVGAVLTLWWPLLAGWPAPGAAWGWLAGLGVLHTGLAYVVLYAGMGRLSTSRIALLQFVYPAAAVLVDWLVYGRLLSPVQWTGVALMGVALWSVRRGA